jgi:spore germination cell wall hydrolase CwlJ-like protein
MSVYGKMMTAVFGAAALSGTLFVPSSSLYASPAPPLAPAAEAPAPSEPVEAAAPIPAAPIEAPAALPAPEAPEAPEAPPAPTRTASSEVDGELECLAKIVLHEAGNQSRTGQIAVAEVVMNRVKNPRFPKTICAVALQRGQFFNVHAYRPHRDRRWPTAVAIAREVRDGEAEKVTNGAFFFRAHHGAPFRGRTRVATIGDHAFYR